jgi:hypothetical protein
MKIFRGLKKTKRSSFQLYTQKVYEGETGIQREIYKDACRLFRGVATVTSFQGCQAYLLRI